MALKKAAEVSPEVRRKSIEADVAAYLAAGNKIEKIPSGTSSQDSQGRGKQLGLGPPKEEGTDEQERSKNEPEGEEDAKNK